MAPKSVLWKSPCRLNIYSSSVVGCRLQDPCHEKLEMPPPYIRGLPAGELSHVQFNWTNYSSYIFKNPNQASQGEVPTGEWSPNSNWGVNSFHIAYKTQTLPIFSKNPNQASQGEVPTGEGWSPGSNLGVNWFHIACKTQTPKYFLYFQKSLSSITSRSSNLRMLVSWFKIGGELIPYSI